MGTKYTYLATALIIMTNCTWADAKKDSVSPLNKSNSSKNIHLIIENKNTKDLGILIKPESLKGFQDSSSSKKVGWLALTIPAAPDDSTSSDSEFSIPANELGEFEYYSITGETNPLTPIGTCYNLERGKCYKIKFTNNTFGTDCISTEIKGNIPLIKGAVKIIPSRKSLPVPESNFSASPDRPSEVLTPREKNY